MREDVTILRKLAYKYYKISHCEGNFYNIKLHTAVNDLKQIRPVVLIDELPWSEMNIDNELTLMCKEPYFRNVEWFLRSSIYKNKYMPADMVLPPFIPIRKVIHSTGIGIEVKEETLATDAGNDIISHKYIDILRSEEDLEKLHAPILTYDYKETMRRYSMIGDAIGDIVPVMLVGRDYFSSVTLDNISRYRGVTNLLMDLVDRPEFMHKIIQKLTDYSISELDQLEELGLFSAEPYNLHCTPLRTSYLPSKNYDGIKMTRNDVWGRGTAQIFATVSKAMHNEFDIDYMIKSIGQCGLTYYGCCEPLDKKIDIIERIPNLRKISITPWANVNIAAEAIGKKYVLSSKPNPSSVSVPMLDKDNLRKEINEILNACKRNNCCCDIVLKDISSCGRHPNNIFEWEQVVMEMVKDY